MKEFYLPSHGAGQLHCCCWEPEGTPRAIVQIVHGIAEYVERYDAFARFLTRHGFLVVGEDHMGHGKSIGADGRSAYFSGGWEAAVADTYGLFQHIRAQWPQTPYFLFGHSMGSFMARTFLIRYPYSGLQGAVLCGTGWQPAPVLRVGAAVCAAEARRLGRTAVSPRMEKLMFGTYCRRVENRRTAHDWICSVPEVVDAYCADPLCGFPTTVGLAQDLLHGLQLIQSRRNLNGMLKTLPVLFIAGLEDPVGDYGRGVERTVRAFREAGMLHLEKKLYPGARHELLNESIRETVMEDVLAWLERQLPAQ